MKKRNAPRLAATLAIASGAILFSRGAYALGPIGIEAGAKVGVGSNPVGTTNPVTGPLDPLGFGLGARAGITFVGFYAGAGSWSLSCSPVKPHWRPSRRNGSNEVLQIADYIGTPRSRMF